jgi:hypothetical protein
VQFHRSSAKRLARLLLSILLILLPSSAAWPQEVSRDAPKREHQNIQDKFNEAGVEICSPHFSSLRDGNSVAIPDQYISPDYSVPGFRLNEKGSKKDAAT